jgi:isocitrate dehydrogenase kinase/phosphatase
MLYISLNTSGAVMSSKVLSEKINYPRKIKSAVSLEAKIGLISQWILREFDIYYTEFRNISFHAEEAFVNQDFQTSLALSRRRLAVYNESIQQLGPEVKTICPELAGGEELWEPIEQYYLALIKGRYEADLAFAYLHSTRRMVYYGEWKPVVYSFGASSESRDKTAVAVHWSFPVGETVTIDTIKAILDIPDLARPYAFLQQDAAAIARRALTASSCRYPPRLTGRQPADCWSLIESASSLSPTLRSSQSG